MRNKNKSSQAGFAHFILLLSLLALILGASILVYVRIKNHVSATRNHSGNTIAAPKDASDCGSTRQLLKNSPVKPDQISTIIPLGNLAPPGHVLPTTHMYYNYVHTGIFPNQYSVKTTLYVPADMTVTQLMKMDNNELAKPYDAFRIDFAICKQVTGYFILVQQLNDKLAAVMHEPYDKVQTSDVGAAKPDHNYFKNVSVKLSAGEILGYAGGEAGFPDGLDFALVDSRSPEPKLGSDKRWPEAERHYVCSLDYYSGDLSQQLYAKLGNYDYAYVKPGGDQPCGSVYQDVPGTAQGIWATKDSSQDGLWDVRSDLALVHSNYDHSKGAISVGGKADQAGIDSSHTMLFTPASSGNTNLDFNLVKPGDTTYCYNVDNGTQSSDSRAGILIQLTDTSNLRLGKLDSGKCGSGPWQMPANSIDYIR